MTINLTRAEAREILAKKKGNKFRARKTSLDGITFDSKRESEVYAELLVMERVGEISGLTRQRAFNLIVNGELIGRYTADFAFIDHKQDGRLRVVDVKGVVTREFRRTRKLIKAIYQIEVEIWK